MIALSGCTSVTEPIPHVTVAPLGPATGEELAAKEALIASLEDKSNQMESLNQVASGAVYGVIDANASNPDGLPKAAVDAQAAEAAAALPAPTDAQKLAKQQQNFRILAGELAQVKIEMGQKATEIDSLKNELANTSTQNAVLAERARLAEIRATTERTEAAAKLQQQFDAMTKRIAAAEDAVKNQVMRDQVKALNEWAAYAAGAAVVSLGLAFLFGSLAAVRKVAPFSALLMLGSLTCFGLAQIVGLWWFKWAVLAAVGIILALLAWWIIRQYEAGTLKEAAEAKAAQLKDALGKVVPVLDQAYNNAGEAVKTAMDATIFKPLNDLMDGKDKATIHEIRADQATNPSLKTT